VKKYYFRMQALVPKTRLRIERGVGVEGNGMGLLNGQTTNEIPQLWCKGWGGVVYIAGIC
jgi:hypothetical protein